jgi:hypothetical protein
MPGVDELTRLLDNFYTAIFERAQRSQNRRLGRAILNTESDPADTPESEGASFQPMTARAYESLTIAGADQDADPSIFKITSGTGRVQYGSGVLDETSLTVVFRLRPDADSASFGTGTLLRWEDGAGDFLRAFWSGGAIDNWRIQRGATGGGGTQNLQVADTFSSGDKRTIAFRWTTTTLGISIDGAAFATGGGAADIPVLSAALFDLLSDNGASSFFDGGIFWCLVYLGEMTDAQVAALHALGDTDPGLETSAVQLLAPDVSLIWPCVDAEHVNLSPAGECNA